MFPADIALIVISYDCTNNIKPWVREYLSTCRIVPWRLLRMNPNAENILDWNGKDNMWEIDLCQNPSDWAIDRVAQFPHLSLLHYKKLAGNPNPKAFGLWSKQQFSVDFILENHMYYELNKNPCAIDLLTSNPKLISPRHLCENSGAQRLIRAMSINVFKYLQHFVRNQSKWAVDIIAPKIQEEPWRNWPHDLQLNSDPRIVAFFTTGCLMDRKNWDFLSQNAGAFAFLEKNKKYIESSIVANPCIFEPCQRPQLLPLLTW